MLNIHRIEDGSDNSGGSPPLRAAEMELLVNRVLHAIQNLLEPTVRDYISSFLVGIQTRIPANVTQPSHCRALQLRFMNKLPNLVSTGSKIEGENGTCIKVALVDELTREIVKSGPGASARTRLMMIDGDYTGEKDLNEKINEANRRTEQRLTGNAILTLEEGIGHINDLYFVHRRTWCPKRKIVLVATLVDSIDGIRVKAAVMEPFTIKDRRLKLYEKKDIPTIDDSILRLTNIGKGSHIYNCLEKSNITTLADFLRELNLNPERLQQIVGTLMPDKAFKATVSHAEKCIFNREEHYICNGVVFNIVGEIVGGYIQGSFCRFDQFIDEHKVIARNIVLSAFKSGNYYSYTNNGSIVSDQIRSSVNPHIRDIPGTTYTVTVYETNQNATWEKIWEDIENNERIERYAVAHKGLRNYVDSESVNDNNAQKRQRFC